MTLPDRFSILVVTLSDRAFSGEYSDLSGPRIAGRLNLFMNESGWECDLTCRLLPDDSGRLAETLLEARGRYNIIFTTGGTGIGPRDITVETVAPLLSKEIPGIMEFIRVKYGSLNPGALLSRGVAGLMGGSLIYTLPGSVRAVDEYLDEILKTLKHTILMQYGIDTHART